MKNIDNVKFKINSYCVYHLVILFCLIISIACKKDDEKETFEPPEKIGVIDTEMNGNYTFKGNIVNSNDDPIIHIAIHLQVFDFNSDPVEQIGYFMLLTNNNGNYEFQNVPVNENYSYEISTQYVWDSTTNDFNEIYEASLQSKWAWQVLERTSPYICNFTLPLIDTLTRLNLKFNYIDTDDSEKTLFMFETDNYQEFSEYSSGIELFKPVSQYYIPLVHLNMLLDGTGNIQLSNIAGGKYQINGSCTRNDESVVYYKTNTFDAPKGKTSMYTFLIPKDATTETLISPIN